MNLQKFKVEVFTWKKMVLTLDLVAIFSGYGKTNFGKVKKRQDTKCYLGIFGVTILIVTGQRSPFLSSFNWNTSAVKSISY